MRWSADVNSVGIGHSHEFSRVAHQVGDQADGGGFAVGAGHGDDGDAAILVSGKHGGNDRLAHRAAFAEGWLEVHPQAGSGIDFDHAADLLLQGVDHTFAHHVDPAEIEADHFRGADRAGCQILGWTSSVTSVAVPPVLRFALLRRRTRVPARGTESSSNPCFASVAMAMSSSGIRVREVAWPELRCGSRLISFDEFPDAALDHRPSQMADRAGLPRPDGFRSPAGGNHDPAGIARPKRWN